MDLGINMRGQREVDLGINMRGAERGGLRDKHEGGRERWT